VGINANLSTVNLESVQLDNNGDGLGAVDSVVNACNSSLTASTNLDLDNNNSKVWFLNTEFDRQAVEVYGNDGELHVSWYLDVHVRFTSGDPASGATVNVADNQAMSVFTGSTDTGGDVTEIEIEEYLQRAVGITNFTPHDIGASKAGLTGNNITNMNKSKLVTISLDNRLPIINITEPAEGSTFNNSAVEVRGNATDDEEIVLIEMSIDNKTWAEPYSEVSNGMWNWNTTMDMPEGQVAIQVRAFDPNGNYGMATVNITVDTTPPILIITDPEDGYMTNTTPITVVGESEPEALVWFGNISKTPDQDGSFEFGVDLEEGPNALNFSAVDKAGNRASAGITVILDTVPPMLEVTAPSDEFRTNERRLVVKGITETDAKIAVAGRPVIVAGDGNFSVTVTLREGVNRIVIEAEDPVGNTASVTRSVTLDTEPPGLTVVSPLDGCLTRTAVIVVSGKVISAQHLFINGDPVEIEGDYEWPDMDGDFSELVELDEGENILTITAQDAVGNTVTIVRKITLDTTPPMLQITSPEDGYKTKDDIVTVEGLTEPGAILSLGTGQSYGETDGTFSLSLNLDPGENVIVIVATDKAGNKAQKRITITRESKDVPTTTLEGGSLFLIILLLIIVCIIVAFVFYSISSPRPQEKAKVYRDWEKEKSGEGEPAEERGLSRPSRHEIEAAPVRSVTKPVKADDDAMRGALVLGGGEIESTSPRMFERHKLSADSGILEYGPTERKEYRDSRPEEASRVTGKAQKKSAKKVTVAKATKTPMQPAKKKPVTKKKIRKRKTE
jgi:hypothetical protein